MTIDDRLDEIWKKVFEMESEIYEDGESIQQRLEVLELTQRQKLKAITRIENERKLRSLAKDMPSRTR